MTKKIKREVIDPELEKAKQNVLMDIMGRKPMTKPKPSGRGLTRAQEEAIKALMRGLAIEVLIDSTEFGEDKVDPITKQVRPYEKQTRVLMSQEVYPEERQWIEHIMKALHGIGLKKSELEAIHQHMRRLNYEGALRDYYEFFGMTIKELREKAQEYRQQGLITQADRMKKVLDKVDKVKGNVKRKK